MKRYPIALSVLVAAMLTGCGSDPRSTRGFRLPEGDAEKGRQAFLDLQCQSCHAVQGEELPPPTSFNLTLGGDTIRVKTYAELVTSIINPSHVLSEDYRQQLAEAKLSPMPEFNHVMSVEQMIDLVAFLQPRYRLLEADYTPTHYP